VARLLRDARRDLGKMSRAVRGDLQRAQRDLAEATKAATKIAKQATKARRPK
jgi:hypothetical protein